MKNRFKLLALILMFSSSAIFAQQLPIYNQFKYNQFVYNPALTSLNNEVPEISLLHRNQWSGVDGAPETSLISFNGARTENNVGFAAYLYHDNTGVMNTTSAYGNYAYGFQVMDDFSISLGLSAGIINKGIDQSRVNVQDPSDPIFSTNTSGQTTFDFNAGINFSYLNFELGFAVPQLFANSISYSEEVTDTTVVYSLKRHYVTSLSYRYDFQMDELGRFGRDMALIPSVIVRSSQNTPTQIDSHLLLDVKELGWLGAGYRTSMGPIVNVGFNISEDLSVGYAYEFNTTSSVKEFGSTHELALIYRLGSNQRIMEKLMFELEQAKKDDIARMKELEEKMIRRQDSIAEILRNDIVVNANQIIASNEKLEVHGESFLVEDDLSTTASNVVAGSRGFYIVAGVFAYRKNAEKIANRLATEGYDVEYFYNKQNKYYYVFLRKYSSYEAAYQVRQTNINGTYFDELWIKEVK